MDTPNAPTTTWPSLALTGNAKVTVAFLYFAATAMFLALHTLAGAHFNAVAWVLPLALPLAMGFTGWNTGRRLTSEEARQRADLSRWDV